MNKTKYVYNMKLYDNYEKLMQQLIDEKELISLQEFIYDNYCTEGIQMKIRDNLPIYTMEDYYGSFQTIIMIILMKFYLI